MLAVFGAVLAYCFSGVLLGTAVRNEFFKNDTPTKELSFLGKLKRGLLFPLSGAITGFFGYDWSVRNETYSYNTSPRIDNFEALFFSEGGYYLLQFFLGLPIRIGLVAIFLFFLAIRGLLRGIKLFMFCVEKVANLFSKRSARISALADFSADKNKLADLKSACADREELLRNLICEGENLSGELGANGAAERCQALVEEIKGLFADAKSATIAAGEALSSLEAEEKNFTNLSRLREFCKKVAVVSAGAKTGVAEIEAAMAASLASRERILGEFHSAEVDAMGPEVPVEMLEASVKDFAQERSRLRAAQEKALAASG